MHWKVGLEMGMDEPKRRWRPRAVLPARVVLADAQRLSRAALRALVERGGRYTVVAEAESPRLALEVAETTDADVVVVVGAGTLAELAEAARERGADGAIPAVLVTGRRDRRHVIDALRAGVHGFLTDDVDGDELATALESVLAGHRYMSPSVPQDTLGELVAAAMQDPVVDRARELSQREREILELLATGHSNREVGEALHISAHTVDSHRRNIMAKLDAKNVIELVKIALRDGLVRVED